MAIQRRRPLGVDHPPGRSAGSGDKELPEEEQQQTRTAIEENLAQYRQNGEMVVPAACWGVDRGLEAQPARRTRNRTTFLRERLPAASFARTVSR